MLRVSVAGILKFWLYAAPAIIIVAIILGIWTAVSENKKEKERKEHATRTVMRTRIIDSSHTATAISKVNTGSAVSRGVVGGMIAGPVGAIVGASTAKQDTEVEEHHTTTFMVYYSNGTRRADTVENGTELYNIYMNKLDMD